MSSINKSRSYTHHFSTTLPHAFMISATRTRLTSYPSSNSILSGNHVTQYIDLLLNTSARHKYGLLATSHNLCTEKGVKMPILNHELLTYFIQQMAKLRYLSKTNVSDKLNSIWEQLSESDLVHSSGARAEKGS